MKLIVHTDGGARGNPGPAAIGVVIEDDTRRRLAELGKPIGEATNNVAEYAAVVEALTWLKDHADKWGTEALHIDMYLDSVLVVNQLNGIYKVKDARLREFLASVRALEQEVGGVVQYVSIPREQNSHADFLVNRALDRRQ